MRRTASLATTAALLAVPVLALTTGLTTTAAHADNDGNDGKVCVELDSGKIDTTGDPQTVTYTAPAGQVVTSYCVKAGSTKQGDGPVYVQLEETTSTLVIRHPSGKAVSHYSVALTTATPPVDEDPTEDPTEDPEVPENPPATDGGGFDWNWQYATPTCDALTVAYPSNLPDGQANDVNIRIRTAAGDVTLNYHNNDGTWSGTRGFTYSQHAQWPAGVTEYAVVWTQVGGSNYHFGESFHNAPVEEPVRCRISSDGDPDTYDVPRAVTDIEGFRTAKATVARGRAVAADVVAVSQPGLEALTLQKRRAGTWTNVRTQAVSGGSTRVTFPKEARRGTFRYRLVLPGSESVTGDLTHAFKVRVR
ncbi:MAG: hypothetical protein Q8O61_03960 [Nocardioides sp.]|nr:hypothetical protein [Nocardioides sp.]